MLDCLTVHRCGVTLLVAHAVLACSADVQTVFVDRPTVADAKTEILAVHHPNGLDLFVVDLTSGDEPIAGSYTIPDDDQLRLEALIYDLTIAELGLAAGPLTEPEDVANGMPIPEAPKATFRALLGDGTIVEPWASTAQMSAEVARMKVERQSVGPRCPEFQIRPVHVPVNEGPSWIVRTSSGALMGVGEYHRYLINADQQLTLIDGPPSAVALEGGALELEPNEFIVSEGRGVWYHARWTGELELEELPNSDRGTGGDRFDVGWRNGKLEIFDVSASGFLARYYDDDWDLLEELGPNSGVTAYNRRGVVRTGSNEAIFAWPGVLPLQHFRNDELIELSHPSADTLTAIEQIDGLGFVLGTSRGGLMMGEPGAWTLVPGESSSAVTRLVPFRGGVAVGGEFGMFAVWLPELGLCEFPIGHTVHEMLVLPDETIAVAGRKTGSGGATVTFVTVVE